jgi:hypothetical protein
MLDTCFITQKECVLRFFNTIDYSTDIVSYKKGFLVNDWSAVAKTIDGIRIGHYELSFKERAEFFGRVNGLCFVELDEDKKGNVVRSFWKGSCFHYFDSCWCVHAAILQYRQELQVMGNTIPTRKRVAIKKRRRSQLWMDEQCRVIESRRNGGRTFTATSSNSTKHEEQQGCGGIVVSQTQEDD